jgi:hypothetical protein
MRNLGDTCRHRSKERQSTKEETLSRGPGVVRRGRTENPVFQTYIAYVDGSGNMFDHKWAHILSGGVI